MKKTLVALAVLAAAGTSFAQVTVSGKLAFSYEKNATAGGGSANHGMKMTDGDLNFAATEDLGGGMSATAKSAFASRGRDNTFAPRDASLTLKTGAGLISMGSIESANAIINTAGAPVSLATGHDNGVVLSAASNVDYVAYALPIGPVVVGLTYSDSIGAAGTGAGNATGTGVSLSYAAGPLSATVDHTTFSSLSLAATGTQTDGLSRTRLFGAYDLGVAKLGAGIQVGNHDKPTETSMSVSVPLGAVSIGLLYSNKASQSATAYTTTASAAIAAADSKSGTAVGATYMLSKMTNVNVSYSTYSSSTGQDNEYRIRLMQAF